VGRPTYALALAALIVVSGCSGGGRPQVAVAAVGRSDVTEVVEAPATVSARATGTVTAAADGRVDDLRVREGQQVRAGAVLLHISSPSAQRALRQARRADAQAAATGDLPAPASGLGPAEIAADARAEAAFARARQTARALPDPRLRRQALAGVAASAAQYAAARAQAEDAVARFRAGLGDLSAAVSALSAAQRVQTRSAVAVASSTVRALTVRAPVDGTVSLTTTSGGSGSGAADLAGQLPDGLQSQAGQLLGGGGTASVTGTLRTGAPVSKGEQLVTVTDSSTLSLTAQVDETDVLLVRRGVPATAVLDAVPDARYDAAVRTIDPTPVSSSRGGVTYLVRLSLGLGRSADGSIAPVPRAGMSAVVDLRVRTARNAVAVPASAVFRDGRRDAVWVVEAGRAGERTVRLGAQGRSRVQVVDGLRPGARIVIRGADVVHDGDQVP
jgi:multidrug efflux pump subunit AcrA (membrane-fusion protein)